MTTITLYAQDQQLLVGSKPLVASGSQNSVLVHVDFDEAWNGYATSGVFFTDKDENVYERVMTNGECVIPHEVLEEACVLRIGIMGVNANNNSVKTTSLVRYKIVEGAPVGDGVTVEPTEDVYHQLLTALYVERGRINNIIRMEDGSTTGDAELADIRIGYDGTEYPTAGEAVRSQIAGAMNNTPTVPLLEILDSDPPSTDLREGRMWIVKKGQTTSVTAPVISLSGVSGTSVIISLNNSSYDNNGGVVAKYRVYANGVLYGVANLISGATYTLANLNEYTTYNISVCGVVDNLYSERSNVVSATTKDKENTPEIVFVVGSVQYDATSGQINVNGWDGRANAIADGGEYLFGSLNGTNYYFIPLPKTATSVTVKCDGLDFGVNGWAVTDGGYSYVIDSGWKASGATCTFEAGVAECFNITFKKADGTVFAADYDFADITIAIA